MDEARKVIRRLERIEALQGTRAPAEELLAEVRELLAEGEAWLAAEDGGGGSVHGDGRGAGGHVTSEAAAALASCRTRLGARGEVRPGTAGTRDL